MALLIALGAVLLASSCGEGSRAEPDAHVPAPPPGMRWVGAGKVVVAVPDWWTTGETRCSVPVEDTVYFDRAATVRCADGPDAAAVREVSALAVLDADRGYARKLIDDMTVIGELDDRRILELPTCEERFDGVCRRIFAVPSEGVAFAVTIADGADGDYESIRDSLRVLPGSATTVPLATRAGGTPTWGARPRVAVALLDRLRAAGLAVEVEVADSSEPADDAASSASFPAGTLLDVSPPLGSPIDAGGTVTVTVSGGPAPGARAPTQRTQTRSAPGARSPDAGRPTA